MGTKELSPEEIERASNRRYPERLSRPPRGFQEVLQQVARETRVNAADILSRDRDRRVMRARRELYVRLRAEGYSYPAIGKMVGRDHTTVLAVVRGEGW
jgi:chromosomal replication initiation ATPase DnaA